MLRLSLAANPFFRKAGEGGAWRRMGGRMRDHEKFVRRPRGRISHERMVLGSADLPLNSPERSCSHVAND
jgi:hypothetical protein